MKLTIRPNILVDAAAADKDSSKRIAYVAGQSTSLVPL